MLDIQESKLIKYLTFFSTLAICTVRPATAVAELAMGIALLLGIILRYNNKNDFSILNKDKRIYESLWRICFTDYTVYTLFR